MPRKRSAKAILEEIREVFRDSKEYFANCGEFAGAKLTWLNENGTGRIVKDIALHPDNPVLPQTKAYRAAKAKLAATPVPK